MISTSFERLWHCRRVHEHNSRLYFFRGHANAQSLGTVWAKDDEDALAKAQEIWPGVQPLAWQERD